ncbi:hypothetical protein [Endozoicomonas montiporae]|uniref:hypothetical protein n=1 Tax=Endozoicomonas montiporae TaxID=1027273 RepID=UPI000A60826E|nr:hypothetical protein [Endozoicomonas montiporae]
MENFADSVKILSEISKEEETVIVNALENSPAWTPATLRGVTVDHQQVMTLSL